MGGNWSSLEREPSPDHWWPAPQLPSGTRTTDQDVQRKEAADTTQEVNEERRPRGQVRQEELDVFKEELARKRALRHEALATLQTELLNLRSRVAQSEELKQELDQEREEKKKLVLEKEKLMEQIEQKAALEKQIQALKDVSQIGKEMLRIRELQVKELKKKLIEINISSVIAPPEDLRIEYEKQIENIRKLRTLYEERAAATLLEHRRQLEREEARITVLETKLSELQKETDECKEAKNDLEGKIEKLESTIQAKEDELVSTKDQLFSSTIQNNSLNSQIKLINNLFSNMLVSPKVDLDRLIRLLKENHGLITDLTEKGDSNEVAALLVDLAEQVEKESEEEKESQPIPSSDTSEKSVEQIKRHADGSEHSQSEIASNLSKVWKVMIELLSHHQNSNQNTETAGGVDSCYKSIQTPSGPRSVISVSQTFLTLKDLILEKNKLVKEVGRLKTLNSHLEHRLGSQEKRLLVVTSELRKTWGVVNKLKAQHKQLHTHEKILRYELQQKRCMLNELKQELDHCRDKWEQARQKNSQTEEDWKKLRKEFAARKTRKESNSAESGYEEEDVAQSPPSEPITSEENLFEIRKNEGSETELSEEDLEHSDGNSFDTVIDLLDITCIENQAGSAEVPFVLCEAPAETPELLPSLLPLTGSEFTEGLDQIESEDLAAVLDIQYQNQLLGADYNLSLPSSSGSSPIPNENDDFASSETDVSEEDSSSNDNHIYTTPLPMTNQTVSEDKLLFGSNSSQNISKFLEGLFIEHENNRKGLSEHHHLHIDVPSTSQSDENDSTTPIVNNESCYQFPATNTDTYTESKNLSGIMNQMEMCEQEVKQNTPRFEQQPISQYPSSSAGTSSIKQEYSISSSQVSPPENRTVLEEGSLKAREEKLKKLEKQCRSLVYKVMSTSFKSDVLSNKLDELHLCYSPSEEVNNIEQETTTNSTDTKTSLVQNCDLQSLTGPCKESSAIQSETTSIDKQCEIVQNGASVSGVEKVQLESSIQEEEVSQETLEVRAARLSRLEDQCKSLFSKMSASSSRNESVSNKQIEQHGSNMSPVSTAPHQPKIDTSIPAGINSSGIVEFKSDKKSNIEHLTTEKRLAELPDLDSESKEILRKCSPAGPSSEIVTVSNGDTKKDRTPEQILEARAERFKRLEEQCKSLVSKMTATSLRSEIISNKLDELHSCYGSSESSSSNEEHSIEGRVRHSPSSSPRHNRRMVCSLEKDNSKEELSITVNNTTTGEVIEERVNFPQTTQPQLEESVSEPNDNTDRSRRTPEEIVQARAQRLDRLEEQCKSLFSKMSATSQRSDIISNRLEELHEQYGQSSTLDNSVVENTDSTPVANTEECDRECSHISETDQVERSSGSSSDVKKEGTE